MAGALRTEYPEGYDEGKNASISSLSMVYPEGLSTSNPRGIVLERLFPRPGVQCAAATKCSRTLHA